MVLVQKRSVVRYDVGAEMVCRNGLSCVMILVQKWTVVRYGVGAETVCRAL